MSETLLEFDLFGARCRLGSNGEFSTLGAPTHFCDLRDIAQAVYDAMAAQLRAMERDRDTAQEAAWLIRDEVESLTSKLVAAQAERDDLGLTLEAALEREIYAGRQGVALRAERDEAMDIAKRFGCGCLEPNDFCPACAELADFAARIASREKP